MRRVNLRVSLFNPTALRTAKTPQSFGRSECNRVNVKSQTSSCQRFIFQCLTAVHSEDSNIKTDEMGTSTSFFKKFYHVGYIQ